MLQRPEHTLEDYFLVDIDAHVTETQFWPEILSLIDNDVIRHMGQAVASRPGTSTALLNSQPGTLYQHVYGRIPHQIALAEAVDGTECHHFTELARRAVNAMGLDYQVVFRRRCCCSVCTRRMTSRLRSAALMIVGSWSAFCPRRSGSKASFIFLSIPHEPVSTLLRISGRRRASSVSQFAPHGISPSITILTCDSIRLSRRRANRWLSNSTGVTHPSCS
jgi:hypothetical protein